MPKEKFSAADASDIELRFKQMQIEEMEERMADRRQKRERADLNRERQVADFKKGEAERLRRQRVCKHRKGGKDNRFAQGNSPNYSINTNTYPDGRMVSFCTRCGKEVERPTAELRRRNPELYAKVAAEWNEWSRLPTDNSPSGGKIFEIPEASNAAA